MALYGVNPGEYPDFMIVGLGNPGQCYDQTRHNIGFKFVDYLDEQSSTARGIKKKLHFSLIDKCVIDNRVVYLVKPQTYMNNSGLAVQDAMFYYHLKNWQLIVVHDDITLPVGNFKIKVGGSAGGHNGIKSIIQHMGTGDFTHIKIGVGQKPEGWNLSGHVLSKFSDDEYSTISKRFPDIRQAITAIFDYGVDHAMNKFNPIGANKVNGKK